MTLSEAYQEWKNHQPEKDCCLMGHYRAVGVLRFVPRRDLDVCLRERAWRRVVRLRDGDTRWPLGLSIEVEDD